MNHHEPLPPAYAALAAARVLLLLFLGWAMFATHALPPGLALLLLGGTSIIGMLTDAGREPEVDDDYIED